MIGVNVSRCIILSILSLNRNFLKSVVLFYRIFCFDIVLPFFIFFFFIISMSITINLKID